MAKNKMVVYFGYGATLLEVKLIIWNYSMFWISDKLECLERKSWSWLNKLINLSWLPHTLYSWIQRELRVCFFNILAIIWTSSSLLWTINFTL